MPRRIMMFERIADRDHGPCLGPRPSYDPAEFFAAAPQLSGHTSCLSYAGATVSDLSESQTHLRHLSPARIPRLRACSYDLSVQMNNELTDSS